MDSAGGNEGMGGSGDTDYNGRENSKRGNGGMTGKGLERVVGEGCRTQIRVMRRSGLQSRETGRRKFASRRRVPVGGRLPVAASIPGHIHTD